MIQSPNDRETVLVLGASSDIGLEIIRRLAIGPAVVVAHYHRSLEKLDALRQSLPAARIEPIRADLSHGDDLENLVAAMRDRYPPPDKIVHLAAAKLEYIRFKDFRWEHFQQDLNIQLRSIVILLQAFLPEMAKRRRGKVVVALSSVTLGVPPAALAHYVVAKYALLGLVRSLAAEYSTKQLNINAVSPSMVQTAFLDNLPERMIEIAAGQAPFQRNATPADVAGAVCYLLSDDAAYVTGANLPVCGGSVF
jgi:3-oxoacyl-[acyl-carrier protein] reductase